MTNWKAAATKWITQLPIDRVPCDTYSSAGGEKVDQLFHVIIGIYEGGDFRRQKGEIRSEILEDLRDWHKTYVPDHEFEATKKRKMPAHGYMRHIHINHGPELERSIEEVCPISQKRRHTP